MYYKRPTKGVFSGQIVARSGHSFRSFIRLFIRGFRVIRGQVIFAFGPCRQAACDPTTNNRPRTNQIFKDLFSAPGFQLTTGH